MAEREKKMNSLLARSERQLMVRLLETVLLFIKYLRKCISKHAFKICFRN